MTKKFRQDVYHRVGHELLAKLGHPENRNAALRAAWLVAAGHVKEDLVLSCCPRFAEESPKRSVAMFMTSLKCKKWWRIHGRKPPTRLPPLDPIEDVQDAALSASTGELKSCAARIRKAIHQAERSFREYVKTIGSELRRAQELLSHKGNGRFERWCKEEFAWSRQRCQQLMDAAEVVERIATTVAELPPPSNENQCRALAVVPEDDLPAVWKSVVEHANETKKPITASMIRKLTAEYRDESEEDGRDEPPKVEWSLSSASMALMSLEATWVNTASADDAIELVRLLRSMADKLEAGHTPCTSEPPTSEVRGDV